MSDKNRWLELLEKDPDHSAWYIKRFRDMAAEGRDLDGEARMIDAMAARGSRILDAGCGPGRLGGALHRMGHRVVGVDLDPALIEAALEDHPGPTWIASDLAELDLDLSDGGFDLIASAGNVVAFLAPSTRRTVLARLRAHLAPDGRLVIGFGSGRDYAFRDFRDDLESAGLWIENEFSTWDLRPFMPDSEFLITVSTASD